MRTQATKVPAAIQRLHRAPLCSGHTRPRSTLSCVVLAGSAGTEAHQYCCGGAVDMGGGTVLPSASQRNNVGQRGCAATQPPRQHHDAMTATAASVIDGASNAPSVSASLLRQCTRKQVRGANVVVVARVKVAAAQGSNNRSQLALTDRLGQRPPPLSSSSAPYAPILASAARRARRAVGARNCELTAY